MVLKLDTEPVLPLDLFTWLYMIHRLYHVKRNLFPSFPCPQARSQRSAHPPICPENRSCGIRYPQISGANIRLLASSGSHLFLEAELSTFACLEHPLIGVILLPLPFANRETFDVGHQVWSFCNFLKMSRPRILIADVRKFW